MGLWEPTDPAKIHVESEWLTELGKKVCPVKTTAAASIVGGEAQCEVDHRLSFKIDPMASNEDIQCRY